MMFRYVLAGMLLIGSRASADGDTTFSIPKSLQERIERTLDKAGISFGGVFQSGRFGSTIHEDGLDPQVRTKETEGFSSVDFDIRARPNESISGRAVLRLHHNWENFYSDPGNPLFSRWLSIDGNLAGMLPFHLGDFTARLTPLTLAMPEIDILYEPDIFARQRKNAMSEFSIDENKRPLQGLNVGFNGAFRPLFDRSALTLFGTRLRSVDVNIENGQKAVNTHEGVTDFSTLFFGTDLDTRLLTDYTFGSTFLLIADHKGSSRLPDSLIDRDARTTRIVDFRAGWNVASLIGLPGSEVRFYGEAAFSFDDTAWSNANRTLNRDLIFGSAGYGGIAAALHIIPEVKIDCDIRYLRNKANFRNQLAQSPGFIGTRIMNVESDSIHGNVIVPNHYSTFDALYHDVFKFCPSRETNLWHKAPFVKSSYSNNVYTQKTLDSIEANSLDPAIQLVMPFGEATPDRQGAIVHLRGVWGKGGFEAQALLSAFTGERLPAWRPAGEALLSFRQLGGGLSWDISTLAGALTYPCTVSGSFLRESRKNDKSGGTDVMSDFINIGLSWRLLKRLTMLAGLQRINAQYNSKVALLQTHTSAGFSWSLTKGAELFFNGGGIWVDGNGNAPREDDTYHDAFQSVTGIFHQYFTDVSLRVHF